MKKTLFILLCTSGAVFGQSTLDKQGHRGSRGLMPENTIPAMIKAMDIGVNTLELDVVISKDGQVVVSHDTYLSSDFMRHPDGTDISPTEAKELILFQMPYEQIKKFDAGTKPHAQFPQQKKFKTYRPLLSDMIDSVEVYASKKGMKAPKYNIEIKSSPKGDGEHHPAPQEFVDMVMKVCGSKKLGDRLTIQSFDVRPLQVLHKSYPKVILSYLTANPKTVLENLELLGFTPQIYSPYYKTVTAASVKECHDLKMQVVPWTVNTKEEIKQLAGLGVDGIISDYPDLF
ncbi:glycerophosphodiester phosphodiesterase [Dyadobacter luteus]|uniref:Glycerophosphodiester phosphodiesterase n=1 Tax=Dyadobacter luteus TaxID=2259619 RepID=A0A3D8YE85_9BACT|nr:glycerophosphodiester phosphodiesterase family protein [Dyadobacter luteus]REA62802.1 glycerophosphodiester phosphodiesterase [Dyadobacter luteus]